MPISDPPLHDSPPAVRWQQEGVEAQASHFAWIETDRRVRFAAIAPSVAPAGMWQLRMFPKGRRHQFEVYFPALEMAKRAVEVWVRHYWHTIERCEGHDD